MDNDYRGTALLGLPEQPYRQRRYRCPRCGAVSARFWVVIKSPRLVPARGSMT
jgi:hypothetical protein